MLMPLVVMTSLATSAALAELEAPFHAAMSVAEEAQVGEVERLATSRFAARVAVDTPAPERPARLAEAMTRLRAARRDPLRPESFSIAADSYLFDGPGPGRVTIKGARRLSSRGVNFLWRNMPDRAEFESAAAQDLKINGLVQATWMGMPVALEIKGDALTVVADLSAIEFKPRTGPGVRIDVPSSPLVFARPGKADVTEAAAWRWFLAGRGPKLEVPEPAMRALSPALRSASNEFERKRAEEEAQQAVELARREKPALVTFTHRARAPRATYDFDRSGYVVDGLLPNFGAIELVLPEGTEFFLAMDPAFAEQHGWRLTESDMLLVHIGGTKTSAATSTEIREKQLKQVKDRLGRGILNMEALPPARIELRVTEASLETADGVSLGQLVVSKQKKKPTSKR